MSSACPRLLASGLLVVVGACAATDSTVQSIEVCGASYELPLPSRAVEGDEVPGETDGDEVRYFVPVEIDASEPDRKAIDAGLPADLRVFNRAEDPEIGFPYGVYLKRDGDRPCEVGISVVVDELTLFALETDARWATVVSERRSAEPP